MKRIIITTAFMLAVAALVAPASAQEAPAGSNFTLGIEGWNDVPTDTREDFISNLRDSGLLDDDANVPSVEGDFWTLEISWGDFSLIFDSDDEEEAYRAGYQAACVDIQNQYPDLELEGC